MNKNNAVVVYSGGMDSYTLLNDIIKRGGHDRVFAVTFNYGQRHDKEIQFAMDVCTELGIEHNIVDIAGLGESVMGGSSQTSDVDVPEGHYEEESMKATVVPNRNMIMLSLAMGYCVMKDAATLYYGAHAGDHAIYPDCREDFIDAMKVVARTANYLSIDIEAPYYKLSKGRILSLGVEEMNLDYGKSWTCYNGRDKACGKCGACQERLEAFAENNLTDPLEYEA